ncbi:hypothetical protein [Natronosalvus rutilus]|uniref:Uncharacterized protein n=1 Tax=Natronosalvus rutilus TaxID=2953753 RepID=A0A9E7SUX1_9EURY|nr:hypothetical protein [Natronosalvus rutilus]UTF52421.1 hypothetical protein NGM29_11535 [Natronosalvus rutilus]
MSVIRQPGRFSRHTRRRLVGVTAAGGAATLDTAAVGLWFTLIVVESRTPSTALAGLGILFCGALLRTGVFGATTTSMYALLTPRRIGVALLFVAAWPTWLLVAERIGNPEGLLVAGPVLAGVVAVQIHLERRVFRLPESRRCRVTSLLSGALIAAGATTLLASAWLTNWTVLTEPLMFGATTVVFRIEAYQLGFLVFGAFAFLAHQRRFQLALEP